MSHTHMLGRRAFLRAAATTGTAAFMGLRAGRAAAEPPPETTTLRLQQFPSGCQGPIHVAGELLRGEGFTDVQYVRIDNNRSGTDGLMAQTADIGVQFSAPFIGEVDRGADLVTLGGIHAGCFVLFGNRAVRSVRDLKGKTVSVPGLDESNPARVYIASMTAYVGSTRRRTSRGSRIPWTRRRGCSPMARSTRSWGFRRSRKSYAPRRSGTSSWTARPTGHGRNTSAA